MQKDEEIVQMQKLMAKLESSLPNHSKQDTTMFEYVNHEKFIDLERASQKGSQ